MSRKLIWAQDVNGLIGIDNALPWDIPEDLEFFKSSTRGQPVVMGLNTWISLPKQPLPDRRNIVVTSRPDLVRGAETVSSMEHTLPGDCWIIGGASIYQQALDDPRLSEAISVTTVLTEIPTEGANSLKYAPPIDLEQFQAAYRGAKILDPASKLTYYRTFYTRRH